MPTTYAAILRRWIDRSGLPPYRAAPLLGVSPAALYGYLNGESLPPNSRIKHLAMALGASEQHLRRVITRERAKTGTRYRQPRGRS